jgi:hypothetical protein
VPGRLALLALALAAGLGGCAKCDVPTFGFAGWLLPAACSGETPRR